MSTDRSNQVVLVLGAGMCCPPLVKYLDDKGYTVMVGSRTKAKAEDICKGCKRATAHKIDVEQESDLPTLEEFTKKATAVVSMLPYLFHPIAAQFALKHKKHFLTTSYVSDKMKAMDAEAKEKGLVFINECGVDPGMDHMSACKVLKEINDKKGKLISFKSYCGGLPAPEDNNNPLGYKFSWAPRGVCLAARNQAKFLENGKIVEIPNSRLFHEIEIINVPPKGDYEAVANRDSISYIDTYSVQGIQTMKRGTLRNLKWSATLAVVVEVGLLDIEENPKALEGKTYGEVMAMCIGAPNADNIKEVFAKHVKLPVDSKPITDLEWLGMFSNEKIPAGTKTKLDCLAIAMQARMQYASGESDMLLMKHEFIVEYADRREYLSSVMVDIGKPYPAGPSSMSTTVSVPVAIATHLVLSGQYTKPGVTIPVIPELYLPILKELEVMGIKFVEKVDKVEPLGK